MPTVKAWLCHAEVAKTMVVDNCGCADHTTPGILTEENLVAQLDHLRTHPSVASRMACGQVFIHGWVDDIETSEIKAYDAANGEFRLIGDGPLPMATPRPRYLPSQSGAVHEVFMDG
jgi:carbonic anhydrase